MAKATDGGSAGKAPRRSHPVLAAVRFVFAVLSILAVVGAGIAGIVGVVAYQNITADLPSVEGLRTYQPPLMSRVYAGDGGLMAELAAERRIFVPYSAIPPVVVKAFLAAEDKSFFEHKGVDPLAILRAGITDLQHIGAGRRPVGASTITQQVARNMLLASNDLSFKRKAKEALLALRIERTLSKERILELYLNEIYLGQGSYGVGAAAQAYFNKPLSRVDLAEAAMLAALPKSPTNYNPFRNPDDALDRRNWVLGRMVENRAVSAAEARDARAEPLRADAYRPPVTTQGAEWFAGEVKRQLTDRFGIDQTSQGGLIVHTSLDPRLQAAADTALRDGLLAYDHAHGGWRGPAGRIAAGADLPLAWPARLGEKPRPPGMLPAWRLGVVIAETATEATIGWLEESEDSDHPVPHLGELRLADLTWARRVQPNGELGAWPRKLADVAMVGDLLMVEPTAEPAPAPAAPKARHAAAAPARARLTLRQIPAVSGALVSLDPRTGRVLAMSGGWSAALSQFNRTTQAKRQPGSSFKPFVYLTAMEQGISPSARFLDAPFVLGDWRPNNYEMTFGGPTPLHLALEESLNLVTVRVAQRVGMNAVARTAIGYHLVEGMPRVLPAALGAVETTVLREAGAYASIEEGGRVVVPTLIDSVQDRDGRVVWRPPGLAIGAGDPAAPPTLLDTREALASPASAFQVEKMMEGVILNGTGRGVGAGFNRPLAGKTGTSQNYNDGWFAGFSPDLVTVVWMGFDNPQTLGDGQDGAHTAGPIWRAFMQQALADVPPHQFRAPPGVTLYAWGCGPHLCVDAFKPDQDPGAGGVASPEGAVPVAAGGDGVVMVPASQGAQPAMVPAQPPRGSGTGVDSGVGGLY